MTRSEEFVTGPWRYERLTCDHWIPVHAAADLGHLAGLPELRTRTAHRGRTLFAQVFA